MVTTSPVCLLWTKAGGHATQELILKLHLNLNVTSPMWLRGYHIGQHRASTQVGIV